MINAFIIRFVFYPTEKVQKGGCNVRMASQGMLHEEDTRLYKEEGLVEEINSLHARMIEKQTIT